MKPSRTLSSPCSHVLTLALALGGATACADSDPSAHGGARVAIAIAPLALPDVDDICYRITVTNGPGRTGDVVWTLPEVCASRYGDDVGAIAYVGTCDASKGTASVTLELEDLWVEGRATPLGPTEYVSPCGAVDWDADPPALAGAHGPCTRDVPCAPNADTAVRFDLTIMRPASQGFFDVAVDLEDVFCSAKLDCVDDDGPLELLFHPVRGGRETTAVVGFACTSGSRSGAPEPTWLHMTRAELACAGQAPIYFNPAGVTDGNRGALGSIFFQSAIYHGAESLPGLAKCFWNLAFGIDTRAAIVPDCDLELEATVSAASFGPSGLTPEGATWPYVRWSGPLTRGGALACTQHGLDEGTVTTTQYTGFGRRYFAAEWQCGTTPCADARPTDTTIALHNAHATEPAFVHLFFIDIFGNGVADSYLCLEPGELRRFAMRDVDPGTYGFLVAVATDADGEPTRLNTLGGEATLMTADGQTSTPAFALSAIAAAPGRHTDAFSAHLDFDGTRYQAIPATLVWDDFAGTADGNPGLALVSLPGDLLSNPGAIGNVAVTITDQGSETSVGTVAGPFGAVLSSSLAFINGLTPGAGTIFQPGERGAMTATSVRAGGARPLFGAISDRIGCGVGSKPGRHEGAPVAGASTRIPVFPPSCDPVTPEPAPDPAWRPDLGRGSVLVFPFYASTP